jgi:hypothetical protein
MGFKDTFNTLETLKIFFERKPNEGTSQTWKAMESNHIPHV